MALTYDECLTFFVNMRYRVELRNKLKWWKPWGRDTARFEAYMAAYKWVMLSRCKSQ